MVDIRKFEDLRIQNIFLLNELQNIFLVSFGQNLVYCFEFFDFQRLLNAKLEIFSHWVYLSIFGHVSWVQLEVSFFREVEVEGDDFDVEGRDNN